MNSLNPKSIQLTEIRLSIALLWVSETHLPCKLSPSSALYSLLLSLISYLIIFLHIKEKYSLGHKDKKSILD